VIGLLDAKMLFERYLVVLTEYSSYKVEYYKPIITSQTFLIQVIIRVLAAFWCL